MCTYCINSRRVALQFTKTTLPVITWKRFLNYVQYNQANEDAILLLSLSQPFVTANKPVLF
jgi:hypothetical protein